MSKMERHALSRALIRDASLYLILLQVTRRLLAPSPVFGLLEWCPEKHDGVRSVVEDAVSALAHAWASQAVCPGVSNAHQHLYYWNPLNLVSCLCGCRGMLCNAIVLFQMRQGTSSMVSWGALCGLYGVLDLGQLAWMLGPMIVSASQHRGVDSLRRVTCTLVIMIGMVGACILWPMCTLEGRRSFDTIAPTVDVHWYLMAEVFPSFRVYFPTVILLMSILMSVGICIKFNSNPLLVFASHGILCSLLHAVPSASMCALWMSLVCLLARGKRDIVCIIWTFCVVTVMNVGAYNLWIQDNAGNANFFYGMNILQAALAGLVLVQLLKLFHT
jgi:hypothetical protein